MKLREYYLRRLTRLEPPYFISLFVCAAAQYVTARRGFHDMAPHLLASFFYLHNMIYGAFVGAVNGVAWSLEIEIQFYILVPLLSLLFAVSHVRLRRTLLITGMLVAGFLTNFLYRGLHWRASIIYYLPFFLAGFLLCDLYLSRKDWTRSFVWDGLALCGWPLVWYMGLKSGHVVLPFVIVVLYLAAFRGKVCSAIFSNRVITDIGGMCYSIYLFHFLVIYAVKHQTWPLHVGQKFWVYYTLQSILIIPWVLLFCGSFFLLVERPCMDREWPRKLWNAFRTRLSSSATKSTIQGSMSAENPQIAESGKAT